ncbi:M12 family metallo-peptidase [Pseudomonas putida]|uniref:zinc-dependent metalloprotease family protein n=1 Tax=Pseudomonas putida TaxID=303 RepID=UPI0030D50815
MNKNMCKALVLGTVLTMASACSSSTSSDNSTSSAATQLFTLEPTPDRNTLQKTASGYLATLLADPANQEITLVKVDPAVVSNKIQDLAVTLPNGEAARFHLRDYNTITPGIDGWVGYKPSVWKQEHASSSAEIEIDPLYYLSLARDGDKIVGSVIVGGQPYRIEYVSPGQHALIKVDESKLPTGDDALEPESTSRTEAIGKPSTSAHSIIRVLLVTTSDVRATRPNNRAELAQALNDANQYMKNSQIEITFELAGYLDADYSQGLKTAGQQLDDMRLLKPFADVLLASREAYRADLVSLYSTTTGNCGKAWTAPSKVQGHSVVTCRWALAHELGHNLGGRHNWKEGDPERSEPDRYGYGYWRSTEPKFYTQMSYSSFCGANCPQIPFFSNPRLLYQGARMGTERNHDVARRFNERRETVENFYPHVVTYTLYEHENYQGQSCTIMHGDMETSYLPSRCGSGWDRKVSSLQIGGVVPGLTIELRPDGVNQTRIHSRTFTGELDVPTMNKAPNFPAGVERVWGGRADDLLQHVSNSR